MQKSALAAVFHNQNKLNRVLDTAGDLFSRHGNSKTSIRSLANEADVSTSTIYSYFVDKSDLLLTLTDRRL